MSGPRPARPLLLRVGTTVALRLRPRSLGWALALLAALAATAVATLSLGRLGIGVAELAGALGGAAEPSQDFVLRRLRGPRLVVAVGTGAALGLAGALFQSVTRNPLGSPDVIGLGAGAGAGAALAALVFPGTVPVPLGAVLGAGAAVLVVAAATGTGLAHPGRLIVAGIGVAAMASAFTHFVVAVAARDQAGVLAAYVNGTLAARSWDHALSIWSALALTAPFLAAVARPVALGELGDALADSLGARARATRGAAIVLSVVLSAAAVSVAGPIAFVSLTAPQIARRLTRAPGPNLVLSAVVGALLLTLADLSVQQVPMADGLPVGIVTMAVGGGYLGFLLVREWRRGAL